MATKAPSQYKPAQRGTPQQDRLLVEEIEALVEVPQWSVTKARAVYDQLRPFFEPAQEVRR